MTIRDESIKALEVALWGLNLDPPNVHRIARESFAASPTLATDLDFATAWRMAGPEGIARLFHETYERLAPDHGYTTRRESAVPWEDVPERNRSLMVATVVALTAALRDRAR